MSKNIETEIVNYPDLVKYQWLDIHAHLNFLEEGPEQAIFNAQKRGVKHIITIGTEPNDLQVVLDLAERHFPVVSCTLGIHPHEANLYDQGIENFILQSAPKPYVVAIGEIGLDYFYKHSPIEDQKNAFEKQLALAKRLSLPVEIHTRDAEQDTVDILRSFQGQIRGVIHCFTGSMWLAEKALDLGYNISLSGIVTFKNAESLREVARYVPIDRMHVETDAPFLTPSPFRGIKNSPQYVIFTAQFLAELKNMSLEDFSGQMIKNARAMFPKIPLSALIDS